MDFFLESCCTSVDKVLLAQQSGAGRIELCENLPIGGVTPGEELVKEVMAIATIPVNVLVRPRGGDFVYSGEEVAQMLESIELCASLGVNAVVVGALLPDGSVDKETVGRLVTAARGHGLSVTFHRAFDICANPLEALEDIIALGCDRLLTSGHEATAYEGRHFIGELVRRSSGRIVVMAGCGVRPNNIVEIAAESSAPEYHSSCFFG